jgi:cytochrome c oxidase subunit 3
MQREITWQGGGSPFTIGSKPLGMWLFIVSDALTFAALLIVYTYCRLANPDWPSPFHLWPSIAQSTLMTFVLLTSSFTMALAVNAIRSGDRAKTVKLILLTMACGIAFIVLHGNEWLYLIRAAKITLAANPWGQPLFGATFFSLTGLHMAHVTAGVIYLGVVATAVGRGKLSAEDVETSGLYWHFVDLVWMSIFPMVYLMSVRF